MTAFRVGSCFRRVEIFRLAFRVQCSPTKSDWFPLSVEDRKHQPPTKTIVRTAFFFFDDQSAAFEMLLRCTFLTKMSRESVPTFGSKAKLKRLARLFGNSSLLEIVANRGSGFTFQLILPPM